MSKVTHISSQAQFAGLLKSSKVVIADCEFLSSPLVMLYQPLTLLSFFFASFCYVVWTVQDDRARL